MKQLGLLVGAIFVLLTAADGANILFLLPVPSPSHRIWNNVLIEALAEKGHNITVLTVEYEISTTNITYIQMESVYGALEKFDNVGYKKFGTRSPFSVIKDTYYFYNFVSQQMFRSKGINVLLQYPRNFKFHAVIHDFSLGQSLLGFVEHFNYPPLISVCPFNLPPYIYAVSATHILPSYMPHYATDFPVNMNAIERTKNSLYHLFDWFYRKYVYMRNENRRIPTNFPGNMQRLEDIEQATDLVLANSDFSLDYVHSLPPNVLPVGGLHVERKFEHVNEDVTGFIERSTKPIILFSLGSNLLPEDLDYDVVQKFKEVFKLLAEFNFICKFASQHKDLPSNVLSVNWFQQNWLMAHPKVKLIISHGGLLTMQEAVWHAKPILGVPLVLDQHLNMRKAQNKGFAEVVDINNFTSIEMVDKVKLLVDDPKYSINVMHRSQLLKSQQNSPLSRAVFAIENVIQFHGLHHLKSPANYMRFFQAYLLDILLILSLVFFGSNILTIQYHIIQHFKKKYSSTPAVEDDEPNDGEGERVDDEEEKQKAD